MVVNSENPVTELTRDQVVDIYMGRRTRFPDGRPALPIDLGPDSPLRAAYYQELVGKTVAQVNAYWARLLFTGRATPPRVLPDIEAVLDVVNANQDALAYLDSQSLDDQVKIVYRLH
ncbi:hypothetical protein CCR91_06515 [Thiorhodovibrio winogradskyi]|nr:hypothetical protein [Thiorhodovibrio winogradskyi]